MPQPPEDLSRLIKRMAQESAKHLGSFLDAKAIERIGRIPPEYAKMETIPVDQAKLRTMIDDIIQLAGEVRREVISLNDMEQALSKVECHYLWFC